eukprot:TRINITY_DN6659_c0_g1_i1.p1 TRINITY_DN6659_c0_g1~~TRINITY_DN6659_c0_g1_i1.p1  ORF type:complete len:241 (+),score=51.73 TRINITY_DN6659_c0_g1_i1:78-725(+)
MALRPLPPRAAGALLALGVAGAAAVPAGGCSGLHTRAGCRSAPQCRWCDPAAPALRPSAADGCREKEAECPPTDGAVGAALAPRTTYEQLWCRDTACNTCDTYYFSTGECSSAPDGLSTIGYCYPSTRTLKQYLWTTSDCTGGAYAVTTLRWDTCLVGSDTGVYNYVISECLSSAELELRRAQRNATAGAAARTVAAGRNATRLRGAAQEVRSAG